MKISSVVVFVMTVLLVYSLINVYILKRGWQALSGTGKIRSVFVMVALFLVLSYPAGRLLQGLSPGKTSEVLLFTGGLYFGFMFYSLIFVLGIDILRLGNRLVRFFPFSVQNHPQKTGQVAFVIGVSLSVIIMVGGYLNASRLQVRNLDLHINKTAGDLEDLNIVMASDIHFGTVAGKYRLKKIITTINRLDPDIVLLPGDIVDADISPSQGRELSLLLRGIKAPLGVFAVPGNHEYYSGHAEKMAYLREGGVTVLMDNWVNIDGGICLIGRKDVSASGFGGERKSLEDVMKDADTSLPLILLDHQPFHLNEAEEAGIDLQLSGHTHNGQLFPLNLINKRLYELNWGYLRKGKTHYYVSCGAGTWGMPVRTAGVPEVIDIKIRFQDRTVL